MPIDGFSGTFGRVQRLFRPLSIAASGLSAQRQRMETISQNIANSQTTRTPEGGPYQRLVTQLQSRSFPESPRVMIASLDLPSLPTDDPIGGVEVVGVAPDASEGPIVYDPGHPDADESGYVRYPNVDLTDETVDMLIARRAYEANATTFQVLKAVLRRALEI